MQYQPQWSPYNQPKKNYNWVIALVVVIIVVVSVVSAVVVLRYVPLKYEQKNYHESITVEPQQTESKWFTVPDGYSVSGSYSVSSSNSVELSVTFQSPATFVTYRVCSEEGSSGSFSFESQAEALEDRYTLSLKNPASSGFFGFGAGATITVTVDFTVSGHTTYLK